MNIKLKGLSQEQIHNLLPDGIVLLGYRGSVAHGTYTPSYGGSEHDDKDIMGVVIAPIETYMGLREFKQRERTVTGSDGVIWDSVVYEIRKYVRLLLKSNPNVLSLLWLPEHLYIYVSEIGQELIDHRDLFLTKQAYHSYVGYSKGQLHRMTHINTSDLGAKRKELVKKFGYDCYDEEMTEFLTASGWKRFDDVATKDMLATVDMGGKLELQAPLSRTDKLYSGPMYSVEPSSSRALVTENHNMLVSSCHRNPKNNYSVKYDETQANWRLEPIRDLIDGYRSHFHIMRSPQVRVEEYDGVDDDYLRLAGAYISEGTTQFRKNKSGTKVKAIRVTQTCPGPFFTLLDNLSLIYPITRCDYDKETAWDLHGEAARRINADFGHKKEKHLPDWCFQLSARQVNILWDSAMLGDGTKKKANDCYYTSVATLADDLQAACTLAGIPCVKYGPYEFEATYGQCTMFHVVRSHISSRIHCLKTCRLLHHWEKPKWREGYPIKEYQVRKRRVVCFEVPNGTLITRSMGRVAIHGNCKNSAHLIRLLRMGIEFLTDGEMHIVREDAAELKEIKNGEWSLDKILKESDRLFALAQEAYIRSPLPPKPDREGAEKLLVRLLSRQFKIYKCREEI